MRGVLTRSGTRAALPALVLAACGLAACDGPHPPLDEVPPMEVCQHTGTTIVRGGTFEVGTGGPDAFVPLASGAELEISMITGIDSQLLGDRMFVTPLSARVPGAAASGPDTICAEPHVEIVQSLPNGALAPVANVAPGAYAVLFHRVGDDYVSGPFYLATDDDLALIDVPVAATDGWTDLHFDDGVLRATLVGVPIPVVLVNRTGFLARR